MDAMLDATSAQSSRAAAATPPAQGHQSLAAGELLTLPGDVLSRILDFMENESEDAFFERTEFDRMCRGGKVEAVRLSEFLSEKSARSWQAAVKRRRGQAATETVRGAGTGTLALRSVGKALRCLLDSHVSTLPISVVFDDEKSREQVLGCLHDRLARVMPLWSGLTRVDLTLGCHPSRNSPGSDLNHTLAVTAANCPNLVRLKLKLHLLPVGSSHCWGSGSSSLSPLSLDVLSSLTRLEDLFMVATGSLVLDQDENFPSLLSLQRLTLQFQSASRECGVLTLSPQPALVDLDLVWLSADVRHLASSTRLRVLSLAGAQIRGHHPLALQEFPSLEQLHVSSGNLDPPLDLQAAPLSLTRLVVVNYFHKKTSDTIEGGLTAYMAGRTHLQALWLGSLSLPQGLDFQGQPHLTELYLCDVAVPVLDLSCLSKLTSLTLHLIKSSGNLRLPCPCSLAFLDLQVESSHSLDLEPLSTLTTLRLASGLRFRLEVRNLGHLTGLTSLRLGPRVAAEMVEELDTLRSLQRLVLEDLIWPLDMPVVWPDFSIYNDLQHLELVRLPWKNDRLRPLRLATSLRVLEMKDCRNLGALDLRNQECLQSLFLDGVPSLREIDGLESVTRLKILSIVEADVIAPTLAPLRGLKYLEKINIQDCKWLSDTTSVGALSGFAR